MGVGVHVRECTHSLDSTIVMFNNASRTLTALSLHLSLSVSLYFPLSLSFSFSLFLYLSLSLSTNRCLPCASCSFTADCIHYKIITFCLTLVAAA